MMLCTTYFQYLHYHILKAQLKTLRFKAIQSEICIDKQNEKKCFVESFPMSLLNFCSCFALSSASQVSPLSR